LAFSPEFTTTATSDTIPYTEITSTTITVTSTPTITTTSVLVGKGTQRNGVGPDRGVSRTTVADTAREYGVIHTA
jgi:hypothetical protein